MKRLDRKKVSLKLESKFLDWLHKHNMVIESPIASDTILVLDPLNPTEDKVKKKKDIAPDTIP